MRPATVARSRWFATTDCAVSVLLKLRPGRPVDAVFANALAEVHWCGGRPIEHVLDGDDYSTDGERATVVRHMVRDGYSEAEALRVTGFDLTPRPPGARRRETLRLRPELIARDGRDCHICGKHIDDVEYVSVINGEVRQGPGVVLNRIVPRSKGGRRVLDNLLPAHLLCATKRGANPVVSK